MERQLVGSDAPAVIVDDLTISLAGSQLPVVEGISLSIAEGEILGLVGESGSGKSTVGLAMLGYARRGLRITSGSVRIGALEMLSLGQSDLQRARGRIVAYVPQDPGNSLNPALRIGSQLREVLELHGDELQHVDVDERVDALLRDVALPPSVLESFPHQLSGGQQQRVSIAMAFACRPRLVVLDEPTTGLDVSTQHRILRMIKELASSYGVSGLYISHDLPVVGEIAASTAVMYAGRIVEQGATHDLFVGPRHPYTAGLLAAAPSAKRSSRLTGIEGHPPRPGRWPRGCAYASRCPYADDACLASVPPLELIARGRQVRCIRPLPAGNVRTLLSETSPSPSSQAGSHLKVSHLTAHYGGAPVLHEAGFELEPGQCVGIVGESGSGKTTLARCLIGLHHRWEGEISLGGVPLASAAAQRSNDQRRVLQYIFQNPFASLNPTMTVLENIEEPLRHFGRVSRRERRDRALRALESVALSDEFADHLPARLSGGERQRVAVGRALVVEPEILICDEVTSALDVSVQAVLVEQLRELQLQRGLSMVFITHNLAVVRSLAQYVIVLSNGVVVERGDVARVLDDPQHEYTRQLLSDLPHLDEAEQQAAAPS
jgi:peptide/nickel transport system ATP-binding protein